MIHFSSNVLLPAPTFAGKDLNYGGEIFARSSDGQAQETVKIWVVNAHNRREIISVCNNLLQELKEDSSKTEDN